LQGRRKVRESCPALSKRVQDQREEDCEEQEALKESESIPWTCEQCRQVDDWQGRNSDAPATCPFVDEGRTIRILPSYNPLLDWLEVIECVSFP
jgi:hypothetical protein